MFKQKILVTGGNGRFAKVLKKQNPGLNLYFASKKECNILDEKSILTVIKKIKPSVVLHTAALSRPMKIHEHNIIKSIELNIVGTANLVKICSKLKIKIVYFSTSYVYEGRKGNYSEDSPLKPFNNYGLSKLGGECSVSMYKNSLILRITMTEKPFMYKKAYNNLISNYMYHEDLVKMLPKLIKERGIINVGGKSQSVYSFAKKNNDKIIKIKANSNLKMPLQQSMSLKKLYKIMK